MIARPPAGLEQTDRRMDVRRPLFGNNRQHHVRRPCRLPVHGVRAGPGRGPHVEQVGRRNVDPDAMPLGKPVGAAQQFHVERIHPARRDRRRRRVGFAMRRVQPPLGDQRRRAVRRHVAKLDAELRHVRGGRHV